MYSKSAFKNSEIQSVEPVEDSEKVPTTMEPEPPPRPQSAAAPTRSGDKDRRQQFPEGPDPATGEARTVQQHEEAAAAEDLVAGTDRAAQADMHPDARFQMLGAVWGRRYEVRLHDDLGLRLTLGARSLFVPYYVTLGLLFAAASALAIRLRLPSMEIDIGPLLSWNRSLPGLLLLWVAGHGFLLTAHRLSFLLGTLRHWIGLWRARWRRNGGGGGVQAAEVQVQHNDAAAQVGVPHLPPVAGQVIL